MLRIFIAVNLPEKLKQEIGELAQDIKNQFPDETGDYVAKWVAPENLHITLSFIGEVKEPALPKINEIVKSLVNGWASFEVEIKRVCYGPPKANPPRLIWLEIEKNQDLECLADILQKELAQSGILRLADSRGFSAHITLARIKEWVWKRIEPEERPEIKSELDLFFMAKSVDVMESKLRRTGSEYATLFSVELKTR